MEVGLTSNNSLRSINVDEINQSLGAILLHRLVVRLKKVRKNAMSINVFSELGERETVNKK